LKPYEDITDPAIAKALAHPLRTRILTALEGRTASPSELADELEAPLGVVSYHVRRLAAMKFVKLVKRVPRRGAVEHYYSATSHPLISDAAWASTPSIVKQATVKPRLDKIGSEAYAALAEGGFDAPETHLTRTPITVDDRGWKQLAGKLEALTGHIERIEAESRKRLAQANHEGDRDISVVLMLFHRPSAPTRTAADKRSPAGRRAQTRQAAER
jgi:DNA-binding transcriptional ArsR family regulator